MDRVPAIDLTPFLDGSGREAVVDAFRAACERIGFVVISGHGLAPGLLEGAFERSLALFTASDAVKRAAAPPVPGRQRGYHGMATRNLGRTMGVDAPPDLRESFFLGPVDDHRPHFAATPAAAESYAPNVLPAEPPGFSETVVALYRGFERLSADLLRVFALALDLDERWFEDRTRRHFSVMSSHHYPPLAEQPKPGQLRTGAHTDFGAMTLLAMSGATGGLEALMPGGRWVPVVAGPGEMVINLGDMMARWTNGRWASTVHRVTNPPVASLAGSRRQSIGYFMHPDYDAAISCIPSCLDAGAAPRFDPTTAGAHIRAKIEASHKAAPAPAPA